jgi:PhnB protein
MSNSPTATPRIVPYLFYEDVASALEWLSTAFGFVEHLRFTDDDGSVTHAEMRLSDGVVMLGDPGESYENPSRHDHLYSSLVVYVDALDEHFSRAKGAGAEVISEPADTPLWGSYVLRQGPRGSPVGFLSAHQRRRSGGVGSGGREASVVRSRTASVLRRELRDELFHPRSNLVPDRAHFFNRTTGRIGELPV